VLINDLPHRWTARAFARWRWAGMALLSMVYLMLGASTLLIAPERRPAHWILAGLYLSIAAMSLWSAFADRWARLAVRRMERRAA
jgi:hypothetical protein